MWQGQGRESSLVRFLTRKISTRSVEGKKGGGTTILDRIPRNAPKDVYSIFLDFRSWEKKKRKHVQAR